MLNFSGILKSTKPTPLGTRQNKIDQHTLFYHQVTAKEGIHGIRVILKKGENGSGSLLGRVHSNG